MYQETEVLCKAVVQTCVLDWAIFHDNLYSEASHTDYKIAAQRQGIDDYETGNVASTSLKHSSQMYTNHYIQLKI